MKVLLGFDVARAFGDGEEAVGDGPAGGGVVLRGDPFVLVLAVEEDDGVGGRSATGIAGRDHGGDGLPDFSLFRLGLGLLGGEGGGGKDGSEEEKQELSGFHHRASLQQRDQGTEGPRKQGTREQGRGTRDKGQGTRGKGQEIRCGGGRGTRVRRGVSQAAGDGPVARPCSRMRLLILRWFFDVHDLESFHGAFG